MNCWKNFPASATLLSLALLALSGCASMSPAEPPLTVPCPKPGPLPAALSRIGLQPSTASLQRASAWSLSSEALLSEEMPKSKP